MKKLNLLILAILIALPASGQFTFTWETQEIAEGENLKEMSIPNENLALLAGYGRTFMQSGDQGNTWTSIPVIDPVFDLGDISINSSGYGFALAGDAKVVDNPSGTEYDVYADGLLLKTEDFGASWTPVLVTAIGTDDDDPAIYPGSDLSFARHPRGVCVLEDNTIYLSVDWKSHDGATGDVISQKGTFKSSDLENWVPLANGGYYSTSVETDGSTVYYGSLNHLFKVSSSSDDAVDIYAKLAELEGDATIYIQDITVHDDDSVFIVTTSNGIWLTSDQGANYTKMTTGPSGGNDLIAINDSVWMVLGTSTKSKTTRDGGLTWEDNYPGATCYEIGGIFNDTVYGLGKSNVYKIAVQDVIDGNYVWKSQEITPGENMQKMAVIDNNNAVIAGYGPTLVRSTDGGAAWGDVMPSDAFTTGAEYDYSAVSSAGQSSWMVARRMTVADHPASSGYSDFYAHGLIFKSDDLWQSWELIDYTTIGSGDDPAFNPNATNCYGMSPTDITCVNDTIAYVYVTWIDSTAGYENRISHANVFLTEDDGNTWAPVFEDLGSKYINSMVSLSKDEVYFMGNTFLRKTEDGAASFIDLYPAMQETASADDSTIFIYDIEYLDTQNWYVLSSGNGIFQTSDGGANYTKLSGIGGGGAMTHPNDSTILVLGAAAKSKITWDQGASWHDIYPGKSIWEIGGILDDKLIALGKTYLYKIPVADLAAPSPEAEILGFVLSEQTGDAVIDSNAGTISIEVAAGTDPSSLSPSITLSEGASVSPASETPQDFSNPVVYTVTAEDTESTKDWTVTVSIYGVSVEETEMKVAMYPNPAGDLLYLQQLEKVEELSIHSLTGGLVLRAETPSASAVIDLSSLENGVYFISFRGADGMHSTRKLVIKR